MFILNDELGNHIENGVRYSSTWILRAKVQRKHEPLNVFLLPGTNHLQASLPGKGLKTTQNRPNRELLQSRFYPIDPKKRQDNFINHTN